MILYDIAISRRAAGHLAALRRYVAQQTSPMIADGYVERIVNHCRMLAAYPERGRARPDLRHGVRSISFEGRATIVYRIKGGAVEVLAIAHGGRDVRHLLR